MSGSITRRMISAYFQEAEPTRFLSGFFRTPAENFHTSEEVEIDIQREEEHVATVITDLSTGGNVNSFDGYTNKSFRPPIFKEEGTLNGFDLIKREAGDDPFVDPNFQANASTRAFRVFRQLEKKVRRAVELMASQVLQTGMLTLFDQSGNTAYQLNFQPKSTHFPTVTTGWGASGSTKLADIDSLANVIRADGLSDPNVLIFGERAFSRFIADSDVQALLDNRRIGTGEIRPERRGEGATFQGFIWINNYRYEMWTYTGRYRHPSTGVSTKFLDDDNVIVMADNARMDLTFGAIPLIGDGRSRVLTALPNRMFSTENGFGMTTNSWAAPDGTSLQVMAGARPLTIPTAIDRYGTLDTQP